MGLDFSSRSSGGNVSGTTISSLGRHGVALLDSVQTSGVATGTKFVERSSDNTASSSAVETTVGGIQATGDWYGGECTGSSLSVLIRREVPCKPKQIY